MSFLSLIKIFFLLLATNPVLYILYKIQVSGKGLSWESDGELLESSSDTLTSTLILNENSCDELMFNARFAEFRLRCSEIGGSMESSEKSTPESEEAFQLQMKPEENDSCNILHANPCCRMFFIATLLSLVLFQTLELECKNSGTGNDNNQIPEDVQEPKNKPLKPVPVPMLSLRRRIIPGGLGNLLQQKFDVHYVHEDYTLVSRPSS